MKIASQIGWVITAAAALILTSARATAGQDLVLRAESMVGGVVKAQRWAPIRVTLMSKRPSFTGEVQITLGDARLRRAVSLQSPGRRDFDAYMRAGRPESVVRIRLLDAGQPIQHMDVPVRVLMPDERLVLCVTSEASLALDATCTIDTRADVLPRSLRGYDAVDEVIWLTNQDDSSSPQRAAYSSWLEFRQLERSGDLDRTSQPPLPTADSGLPTRATRAVIVLWGLWSASLLVVGIVSVRKRIPISVTFALIAVLTCASGGVAYAIGWVGGSTIEVHHASVIHQIPNSEVSLFSTHGDMTFPALDDFQVALEASDSDVQPSTSAGQVEQVLDSEGRAVLGGRFALGARQSYVAEAIVRLQPISITREGTQYTSVNRLGLPLRDCVFADGLSIQKLDALVPGVPVTVQRKSESPGPILTCASDTEVVSFSETKWPVLMRGTTIIAAYRADGPPAGDVEAAISKLGLLPEAKASTTKEEKVDSSTEAVKQPGAKVEPVSPKPEAKAEPVAPKPEAKADDQR